jgi:magnesium-dependent phosphatase 1
MLSTHEAFAETKVAVASRTNRAQWAYAAMELHAPRSRYSYAPNADASSDASSVGTTSSGTISPKKEKHPSQTPKGHIAHPEPKTLREVVGDLAEIYTGSKKAHFQNLREKTGMAYKDMLFFDNERVNVMEVGQLGVCSVYCPGGMSQGAWEEGLRTFADNASRRKAK